MNTASTLAVPATGGYGNVRNAWTAFWTDPAQSRCVAGAPEIWRVLTDHWSSFSRSLGCGTRVLDLGCGAGVVARLLLGVRDDIHVTGIDFAKIPLAFHPNLELLPDTPMESLPFAAGCFGAVVSQFGYEYGSSVDTVRELARVLAPDAKLAFLVHHAESSIVIANRARLAALAALLSAPLRAAFCGGDSAAFLLQTSSMLRDHGDDALVSELARSMPSRLARSQRERIAIWNAIEEALAPERCLAECLDTRCLAATQMDEWLEPVRALCARTSIRVLREPNGVPIAWQIEGVRQPANA